MERLIGMKYWPQKKKKIICFIDKLICRILFLKVLLLHIDNLLFTRYDSMGKLPSLIVLRIMKLRFKFTTIMHPYHIKW